MSKIRVQRPQVNVQEGQRLMIIKLGRYNEIGKLLIGIQTTGLWGHVCYWDGHQRVSVTMVAVHKGRKETVRVQTRLHLVVPRMGSAYITQCPQMEYHILG